MNESELQQYVSEAAKEYDIPGVAVGVYHAGTEHVAVYGTTSVENPLPVDADTLFALGSRGKTYAATAMMRLVEAGRVDLGERVRTYLPELRLQEEEVAQQLTVMHLLNHTSGFEGDTMFDTGEGDDALERYMEKLVELPQSAPIDSAPTYNNNALVVVGRVIEKVTGKTYEAAVEELLLRPLGHQHTFLHLNDIMTRRFACGHQQQDDETLTIVRPWSVPRAETPMGGRIVSSVRDQLGWARFHLGDGRAPDGTRLLTAETLRQMQHPSTSEEFMPGVHIGVIWMLRDFDGLRVVEHGGDTEGQSTSLWMLPEHDFAVTVLTNGVPDGQALREQLPRWAVEQYLGIEIKDPEPLDLSEDELAPYVGRYATEELDVVVAIDGNRLLVTDQSPDESHAPPFHVGITATNRWIATDGPYVGLQGYFVRQDGEAASALHIGRLASRVPENSDVA